MAPRSVPSKIVIAGNSKMSLNERFSTIPKPKPIQKKPKLAHHKVYPHVQYQQQPMEFAPKPVVRRPQHVFQRRAVPLQNRVTFVNTVPIYKPVVPRVNFVQRNAQFPKKTFNKVPLNQYQKNNTFVKRLNNNNHNGVQANRPFKGKVFPTMPKKKSLAELDRELDDYMRKPKHPPITI